MAGGWNILGLCVVSFKKVVQAAWVLKGHENCHGLKGMWWGQLGEEMVGVIRFGKRRMDSRASTIVGTGCVLAA